MGMPRRYHTYPVDLVSWQVLHVLIDGGRINPRLRINDSADLSGWSMRYGRIAEANPWNLPGLEWQTASPPPTENFLNADRDARSIRVRAAGNIRSSW
jgi:cytochrome c oxidase subunit 1